LLTSTASTRAATTTAPCGRIFLYTIVSGSRYFVFAKIVSSLSLATEWFGLLSPVSSQWWITSPCRCTGRLLAPSHVECGVQTNIIDLCCPVYYCGSIDRWHSSAQGAASSRHHSSAAAGCYCNGIGVTIVTSTRVPAATDLAAVLAIDTLMSSAIGHSSFCCCDGSCGSIDY
jgi:hypothetical protein